MAFTWVYNLSGGAPTIRTYTVKASEVISKGEMCSMDTSEVDAGASGDTTMLGASMEAVDNTVDGHTVRVIVNPDAVYEVVDANARSEGTLLDLASGGLLLTTDSNHDLIVVENSLSTELTRVRIAPVAHALV